MLELSVGLQILIAALVAGWGIWQIFATHKLQKDVNRLNRQLDESTQQLLRAREAVIKRGVVINQNEGTAPWQ